MIARIRRVRAESLDPRRISRGSRKPRRIRGARRGLCSASAIFAIHFSRRLVRRNTLSKWRRIRIHSRHTLRCPFAFTSAPLPPSSSPFQSFPLSIFLSLSFSLFVPFLSLSAPSFSSFSLGPLESKFITKQSANFCALCGEFEGVKAQECNKMEMYTKCPKYDVSWVKEEFQVGTLLRCRNCLEQNCRRLRTRMVH